MASRRRPSGDHPDGRGDRRRGYGRAGGARADDRGDRRDGRRGETEGGHRDRGGRDGLAACGDRPRRRADRRSASGRASASKRSAARTRHGSPTRGSRSGSRPTPGTSSCSTRGVAARSSRSVAKGRSGSATACRSGPWRIRSGSAWPSAVRRGDPGRGPGDAGDGLRESRRPAEARCPRRDGRCRDEPGGSHARARGLRPGRHPGHGPRPRGGRPPDRDSPDARRRGPSADRRPAAGARRGDPGRCLHRPDGDGQARPDVTDRQRPGAAPRCDRRAVRA